MNQPVKESAKNSIIFNVVERWRDNRTRPIKSIDPSLMSIDAYDKNKAAHVFHDKVSGVFGYLNNCFLRTLGDMNLAILDGILPFVGPDLYYTCTTSVLLGTAELRWKHGRVGSGTRGAPITRVQKCDVRFLSVYCRKSCQVRVSERQPPRLLNMGYELGKRFHLTRSVKHANSSTKGSHAPRARTFHSLCVP